MTRQEATTYIKIHPEQYFKPAKKPKTFICPLCNNGTGDTGDGITTKDGEHYKCFKCNFYGDVIEYIAAEYGLTGADVFTKAYELYGVAVEAHISHTDERKPQDSMKHHHNIKNATEGKITAIESEQKEADYSNYFLQVKKALQESPEALAYLEGRGISKETVARFWLGYDPNWKSPEAVSEGKNPPASPRIIIPTSKTSYTARDIRPKANLCYKALKAGKIALFNPRVLYTGKPSIFVTEGEFDALSVIEAGGEALALGSTSNYKELIDQLQAQPTETTLIISLDNDQAGKDTTEKLVVELERLKASYTVQNISGEHKDQNEALQADREVFSLQVQRVSKETDQAEREKREQYKQTTAKARLHLLKEEIAREIKPIPTGFSELDRILEGGLTPSLVVIGAISSLGKTTFIMQIADNLASRGEDVLVFSIEMSELELMARSISRLTFELVDPSRRGNAKTTKGILLGYRYSKYSPAEMELIAAAEARYSEYGNNIRIIEESTKEPIGVYKIEAAVKNHISITGKKPLVIVDYLQIIEPLDLRASDKQNTDKAVKVLKQLSRDNGVTVIGISSFNRANYSVGAAMEAFKESGAIEYSADILLALQLKGAGKEGFNVDQAKNADPREIELKILKNRSGKTGGTVEYQYYPAFNFFKEIGETTADIKARAEANKAEREAKKTKVAEDKEKKRRASRAAIEAFQQTASFYTMTQAVAASYEDENPFI